MKFEEGEIERMTKAVAKKDKGPEIIELVVLLKSGSLYCDITRFFLS